MKLKKIICYIICFCMMVSLCSFYATSIEDVPTVTGETSRVTQGITLADGTDTGVQYTQINMSGYYGNNRVVNIAQGDLSNRNLSLEVINCGTYVVSKQTMNNAVVTYNNSHSSQTVLAAVNGDLWMTGYHTHSGITKKTLSATRGMLIIDGEIWASEQIDQENITATNVEKGAPAAEKSVFGVTYENQPIVGSPSIGISVNIGGQTVVADGINRLPAIDSIIVYNHRINSSNYALDDSYEVEITMDDTSAITLDGTVTGKITAIYQSGSTTRPSLTDEKTVVLTARGSRMEELKKISVVGKKVILSASITDKLGNTELWQNVEDAISGHMRVLCNGEGTPFIENTYYPTTFIGYKDDGTVALVTVTSAFDNSRAALKISQSYEFCKELGFNSVFYLDGGGSTTFVTLDEGSYTIRNKCSDGSARAVINGVALVWNEEPVCMRQGSLNHIKVPADFSEISPVYLDGALLNDLTVNPNAVVTSYNEDGSFGMTVNTSTVDPFVTLDYSSMKRVAAEDYPYIVIKLRSTVAETTGFTFYYACGSDTGASQNRTKSFTVAGGGEWQTVTVNMNGLEGWSGNINNIRLDCLEGRTSAAGDSVYISSVILCRNLYEVDKLSSGWIPEGSCTDYADLLESLKPTPYFIMGDISGDGSVDMIDMYYLKLFLKNQSQPAKAQSYSADVDGDGEINMVDSYEMKYRLSNGVWRY